VLQVSDPHSWFMTEELFAPVITAFVYDDAHWADVIRLVDESTVYGLTGAVFGTDEDAWRRPLTGCGTPPATSTSTTNPPVRWWANNPLAGHGPLARMTKSGPSGT